jgi:hypothetical protein
VSGGGFQVVLSELADTATVFDRQSDTFEAIMPNGGPAVPLLGALHQQMSAVIANHGAKLSAAHDNYEHTEETLTELIHNIGGQGLV